MATTKSISRGSGQSAVASASYRAGEKLQDERYGKTQDYSKRHGVMSADIILPTSLTGQVEIDRNTLWNMAEQAEKRKDARVSREWIVNLPHELDERVRKQLAHEFAQSLADKYRVVADCCIHRPTQKEIERGADPRNFHAHIMLTTRQAVLSQSGQLLLGEKASIELSDSKRRSLGLERVSAEIVELRELWERTANAKLAQYGHELIDSRSYQSQGIDIVPQLKMGKNATQMERDGLQTPVGDINRLIKERNEMVFSQELATIEQNNQLADQIIFDSLKPKTVIQDDMPQGNQPEYPDTTHPVSPAVKPTSPNEPDNPIDSETVVGLDVVIQPSSPSSEDKAKQSFQSKYEQWKQQKNAPSPSVNGSDGQMTVASPPTSPSMSFNERRQAWKAEQERKKQEAEAQQRLAEQARLAEIAEKQRQANINREQEQLRQQALVQKQVELAEAKRLAQLQQEQERQAQVREAEQQKLAQQEKERQQEIDRQHELERKNSRGMSP